jgi:regulator of protease activity HflC (stomatin/prohibitin superfamily)
MGITFRSGNYVKFVRLGGRTIKDGEAAAIWDGKGIHTHVAGPKRAMLFYSTIHFLTRYMARGNQYLQVTHRDGRIEHVKGPTFMFLDSNRHETITVLDGIQLATENDQIVVLSTVMPPDENKVQDTSPECGDSAVLCKGNASPSSRVVKGPTIFLPAKDEMVHQFRWTYPPSEIYKKRELNAFQVLKVNIPGVWTWKAGVMTSDHVSFWITLAFTHTIESIDKCVHQTQDPIASILAGMTASLQSIGNRMSSEALKGDSAKIAAFFQPESFVKMKQAAVECGFCITSIEFQSLQLDDKMEKQLEQEQKRSMMDLNEITRKKNEARLQELDVEAKKKRLESDNELERKRAQMQAELAEEVFSQKLAAVERTIEIERKRQTAKDETLKMSDESVLKFLKSLKDMDVDLSQFLCTEGGRKIGSGILDRSPSLANKA